MKERKLKKSWRFVSLLITVFVLFMGLLSGLFFFNPTLRSRVEREWRTLMREGGILGWRRGGIPFEEKRIREEVILKKMEEANTHQDWRSLASEYPRLKRMESLPEEERRKALENSEEFKEVERELKEYLNKREENLLNLEPPLPSLKDETNLAPTRDKAADRVIVDLLSAKEKTSVEKPLEENLLLKIRGPLATRKILERPSPPQVKLKTEGEIELTFWVLPDGMVDRVVPTMKGDTELERIAIQYLKQWRFAPLPKEKPQVEQWGIVPIKFKLQ
jgi:TonB family protein